jgi:hypothetical protein
MKDVEWRAGNGNIVAGVPTYDVARCNAAVIDKGVRAPTQPLTRCNRVIFSKSGQGRGCGQRRPRRQCGGKGPSALAGPGARCLRPVMFPS